MYASLGAPSRNIPLSANIPNLRPPASASIRSVTLPSGGVVTIDIRSVLLADGVLSLVFLSISAFTWRRGHGEIAGPGYWFLGFCCLTAGLGMVALRGLIPDSISIVVGNLVLLAGVSLQLVGIFRYLGLKRRSLELALNLLLIASLALLVYFEIAAPSLKARMISLSLANAAYGAAAVDALLFRCPREVRSYARASAAFWAAFALIYLARVALGIEWKAGEDWMAASSTVDSYAMVLLMMTLSGVAATEMLLLYGKVESTLRVTAAEAQGDQRRARLDPARDHDHALRNRGVPLQGDGQPRREGRRILP